MTYDPLRRRFGHGAARLPIGSGTRGPSLSSLAQRKVPHERLFAAVPAGLCLSLGALLYLTIQTDLADPTLVAPRDVVPKLAEQNEPLAPLEIEFWEETIVPPTPLATEELAAPPEPGVLATAEQSAPTPLIPAQRPDTVAPVQKKHVPAFDPKRLALRAPSTSPQPAALLGTPATSPMRGPRSARPGARLARTPRPQIDLPTRGQASLPSVLTAKAASMPFARKARPGAGGAGGESISPSPHWTANAEQQAFLTAQTDDAGGVSQRTRLSPVSAAAQTRAPANAIRNKLSTGDWQQVPLDTLPDCSPAGRQDELKRQILRAAPFESACTDQNGSFRFVETGNLGAFLMWSRRNPAALERSGRDRDACVALERALLCLSNSSN